MAKRGGTSLRTKIVAVLASLVALWSFAAYVTVREGVSLVFFATLEQQVAKPHEAVVAALEAERRASVAYVVGPASTLSSDLDAVRATTNAAVSKLRSALSGVLAQWSQSDTTHARLADELHGLDTLPNTRSRIDLRRLNAADTAAYFTGLIRTGFTVYDSFTVWNNADVIFQTTTLLAITHLQETISQEDALMAGVLGSGVFGEADRAQFAQLVGAQRYLSGQISDRLSPGDRARYDDLDATPPLVSLRAIEDVIIAAEPGAVPLTDPQSWKEAITSSITGIRAFLLYLADATVQRVAPAGIWIVVRLLLAAGLGLAAVVFSIRFSIRTGRNLQNQLAELRVAALDLAEVRLPDVVTRLRAGEEVDVETSAPPPAYGTDDIGLVGRAFHAVQQTAIRATVEQAELRRGVRDVFLNLARRSQALIHRQLKLIDTMERRAGTDEELAELFRIDHLATRMRRNAENLIVLSGATAGRGWREPVRMVDVVRGALAEVEDYPRIEVRLADSAALTGRAVGDVIHLLAEVMENAVSFSPPRSPVSVTGARAAGGYIIEISDHGLGMSDSDIAEANAQIEDPPEFQLSSTARLGFYVVGRLAQRHQIRVTLEPNSAGGITAVVMIPPALVTSADPNDPGADIDTAPTRPLPAHATARRVGSVGDEAGWRRSFAELPAPATPALPSRLVAEELTETPIGEMAPQAAWKGAPQAAYTPSGLPVRQRKPRPHPAAGGQAASRAAVPRPRTPDAPVAPQGSARGSATVRPGAPAGNGANGGGMPNGRTPEEIREMMAAYQAATRRARAAAAAGAPDDVHRMARHESDEA